jgi:MYXO-CTERM domain-containing protein
LVHSGTASRRPCARPGLLLAVAFALSGCGGADGGQGCGGITPTGEFPDKARIRGGAQVRLTESGFGILADNLTPILETALPGGLATCIAGQETEDGLGGRYGFCRQECPDGSMGCPLSLEIEDVRFETQPPNRLIVHLTIADFMLPIDALVELFGLEIINCDITVSAEAFPVTVPLTLNIEDGSRHLGFELGTPGFDLANLDLELAGNPICDIVNLIFSVELIEDAIFTAINQPVQDAVLTFAEPQLCLACGEDGSCPGGSECGAGDLCRKEEGRCVGKSFGVVGELDLGASIGSFVMGQPSPLRYLAVPGEFAHVEGGGLTLGIIAGTDADPSDCVPVTNPPPVHDVPVATALRGNLDPEGAEFHAAIGMHETLISRALWTAYSSGLLCLRVDSSLSSLLSTGTLGLLLPSLKSLADDEARPLILAISPQRPPDITVGAGIMGPDPSNPDRFIIEEALVTVSLHELEIHFYAFLDDRWVRGFTVALDLDLPVAIETMPDGSILPVLGDLGEALGNVEVRNQLLLAEDPSQLEALLPTLLGLAVPLLSESLLSPISVPPLMGFQLLVNDATGIEDNTMVALFATLMPAPPPDEGGGEPAQKRLPVAETEASVLGVSVPPLGSLGNVEAPRDAWPEAKIDVSGSRIASLAAGELEYQLRLDGASWSLFQPAPMATLLVRDPLLVLPGTHVLEVRARAPGWPETLDRTPAEVEIEVRYQPLAAPQDVYDSPGAEPPRTRPPFSSFHGRHELPEGDGGGGGNCQCALPAGGSRGGPGWWWLALAGLALVRRRRPRRILPLLALGLVLASTGCSGCEDEGPPGSSSEEGEDQGSCAEACEDGFTCPGGCAEGKACCASAGECIELPTPNCRRHECDGGYRTFVEDPGTLDPQSCEPTGVVCGCEEREPLPLGFIGRYVSVGRLPGGGLAFAAWNSTYGDLMFAETNGPRLPTDSEWAFIDGIPDDSRMRGGPSGPRGGNDLPGPNVGRFASLAVTMAGAIHIAYRDADAGRLKHAYGSAATSGRREWLVSVVDETGDGGWFAHLELDREGRPMIAHRVGRLQIDEAPAAGLRVAVATGARPEGPEDWVHIDADVAPHEVVDEALPTLPHGLAIGLDAALDEGGRLVVVHHDRDGGTLRRVVVAAGEVVEGPEVLLGEVGEGIVPGEVGRHPALWIDQDGAEHVAWTDAGRDQLRYKPVGAETDTIIDDGRRASPSGRVSRNLVGADARLVRDRAGALRLVYQDQTFLDMVIATRRDEGWERATAAGNESPYAGAFGFHTVALPALRDEPGDLLLVTYRYQSRTDPPSHGLHLSFH